MNLHNSFNIILTDNIESSFAGIMYSAKLGSQFVSTKLIIGIFSF